MAAPIRYNVADARAVPRGFLLQLALATDVKATDPGRVAARDSVNAGFFCSCRGKCIRNSQIDHDSGGAARFRKGSQGHWNPPLKTISWLMKYNKPANEIP